MFADEPTGNLDTKNGDKVSDLLFDLNKQLGTTLVLVTHDDRLAERCQRIVRLEGGKVVADNASEAFQREALQDQAAEQ